MPNANTTYNHIESFGKFELISSNTADYFAKVRSGSTLKSLSHKLDQRDFYTPGSPALTGSGWNTTHFDHASDGFNTSVGVGSVEQNTVLDQCFNDIHVRLDQKVRNTEIDLGVALGELPETARFITQAAIRSAKAYKLLRKGHVSKALSALTGRKNNTWKDIPGVASNTWLAYAFGFKPLASDVYDAVRIFDKGIRAHRQKPVSSFSRTSREFWHRTKTGSGDNFVIKVNSGNLTCSGKVYYKVNDPALATLDQVGLLNPATVIWELVPFSFVADWFTPIGDYMTAIVPPQGLEFISGYTLVKGKGGTRQRDYRKQESPDRFHDKIKTSVERFKERDALFSFAMPNFHVPDLSEHTVPVETAVALLWAVAGDRSPPRRKDFRFRSGAAF